MLVTSAATYFSPANKVFHTKKTKAKNHQFYGKTTG